MGENTVMNCAVMLYAALLLIELFREVFSGMCMDL